MFHKQAAIDSGMWVDTTKDQDVDSELKIVEVMSDELESYVLDKTVYRTIFVTINNRHYRLMMSGGDLLVRLQTLQAMRENMTLDQKDRLNSVITQVETTKSELRAPLQNLLHRELKSRLATLDWSLEEEVEEGIDHYSPAEISNFLHIAILRDELKEEIPPEVNSELQQLEQQMQSAFDQIFVGYEYKTNDNP